MTKAFSSLLAESEEALEVELRSGNVVREWLWFLADHAVRGSDSAPPAPPAVTDEVATVAWECARALGGLGGILGGDLDDDLYTRGTTALGEQDLYRLVMMVGCQLRVRLRQQVFGAAEGAI